MTLSEILGETMRKLGVTGCSHVVIKREHPTITKLGVQVHREWRYTPQKRGTYAVAYRFLIPGSGAFTAWLDVEGTHFGFSTQDVLATDWMFA